MLKLKRLKKKGRDGIALVNEWFTQWPYPHTCRHLNLKTTNDTVRIAVS